MMDLTETEINEQINDFFQRQEDKKKKPKVAVRRTIEDMKERRRLNELYNYDFELVD